PRLRHTARPRRDVFADLARPSGLPAEVSGETTVFDIGFTDRPLTDYRAMLTADGALLKAFNAECLQRGIVKGREKLYVSLAHTEHDVARTLETFEAALGTLSRSAPAARA